MNQYPMRLRGAIVSLLVCGISAGCAARGGSEASSPEKPVAVAQLNTAQPKDVAPPLPEEAALQRARLDPGASRERLEAALLALGDAALERRLFADAVAALDEALPIVAQNHGPASVEARRLLFNLGVAHFKLNDIAPARRRLKRPSRS